MPLFPTNLSIRTTQLASQASSSNNAEQARKYTNLTANYVIPRHGITHNFPHYTNFAFHGHGTNAFALYNMLNSTQAKVYPGGKVLEDDFPIIKLHTLIDFTQEGLQNIWATNYGSLFAYTLFNRSYLGGDIEYVNIKNLDRLLESMQNYRNSFRKKERQSSSPAYYEFKQLSKLIEVMKKFINKLRKDPEYMQTYKTLFPMPIQIFFDNPTARLSTSSAMAYTQEPSEIKAIACKDEHRSIIEDMIAKTAYKMPIAPLDQLLHDIDRCGTDINARYDLFTKLVNYEYNN